MRRVIPLVVLGFALAAPASSSAAVTCKNNTLTVVGRTVLSVNYHATGVTYRESPDSVEHPCGTISNPWVIHVVGGDPLWNDLVEVNVFDAALHVDVNLSGPTDLLHVNAFDPLGVEIRITGSVLSVAPRSGLLTAGTVTGANMMWVVDGSPGPDLIYGGVLGESLGGGSGGADYIDGGPGDDSIGGGNGPDVLNGGDGEDVIFGGNGQDVITGDAGQDFLHGDWGRDTINAADGEVDMVRGGRKHDTAVVDPEDDVKNVETVNP